MTKLAPPTPDTTGVSVPAGKFDTVVKEFKVVDGFIEAEDEYLSSLLLAGFTIVSRSPVKLVRPVAVKKEEPAEVVQVSAEAKVELTSENHGTLPTTPVDDQTLDAAVAQAKKEDAQV